MAGAVSCPRMGTIAHWSLLLPSKSLSFFLCYHLFLFWIFLFCLKTISLFKKKKKGGGNRGLAHRQRHTHTPSPPPLSSCDKGWESKEATWLSRPTVMLDTSIKSQWCLTQSLVPFSLKYLAPEHRHAPTLLLTLTAPDTHPPLLQSHFSGSYPGCPNACSSGYTTLSTPNSIVTS